MKGSLSSSSAAPPEPPSTPFAPSLAAVGCSRRLCLARPALSWSFSKTSLVRFRRQPPPGSSFCPLAQPTSQHRLGPGFPSHAAVVGRRLALPAHRSPRRTRSSNRRTRPSRFSRTSITFREDRASRDRHRSRAALDDRNHDHAADRYQLELHVFATGRHDFDDTRVYRFQLKQPLAPDIYRDLKLRLYDLRSEDRVFP